MMNRRIFGFHRRVWCPKWTPAPNSCFMLMTAMCLLLVTVDPRLQHPRRGDRGRGRVRIGTAWMPYRTVGPAHATARGHGSPLGWSDSGPAATAAPMVGAAQVTGVIR